MEYGTLTPRQLEVLRFVADKINNDSIAPTLREISNHFNFASPNAAKSFLLALETKGYIERASHKSRSIRLVGNWASTGRLPLLGAVAAGPLTTADESLESLEFNSRFCKSGNFALKVRGNSMIDEHIQDGDFVIVCPQKKANQGAMVVVRTEFGEAALKFFYVEKNRIRLQPGNRKLKPIFVQQAEIIGVVVGVVRDYKPKPTRRS